MAPEITLLLILAGEGLLVCKSEQGPRRVLFILGVGICFFSKELNISTKGC